MKFFLSTNATCDKFLARRAHFFLRKKDQTDLVFRVINFVWVTLIRPDSTRINRVLKQGEQLYGSCTNKCL